MKLIEELNIIEKLFDSLVKEYRESLKTKIKRSDCAFDSVDALYYKITLNIVGSYIDSPEWLKNKKSNDKSKK